MGRTRSGKSHIANRLRDEFNLRPLISSTNRPKRYPNETGYHFYTEEQAAAIPVKEKLTLTLGLDGYERWCSLDAIKNADIAIMDDKGMDLVIRTWRTMGHRVLMIYAAAPKSARLTAELNDAMQHHNPPMLTEPERQHILNSFCHRDTTENAAFTRLEQCIHMNEERQDTDALLYPNLPTRFISLFGEDMLIHWHNDFTTASANTLINTIHRIMADPDMTQTGGTCRIFPPDKKIVLLKQDYPPDTWMLLMQTICGLDPDITEQAVLHVPFIEFTINPNKEESPP